MAVDFDIRPMEDGDLTMVVGIHMEAFEGFFLTRMGPAFLRSYYTAVLSYDRSVALVAERRGGPLAGFVTGFEHPERFYRHFRSRRLSLLPSMVAAALRQPSLIGAVLDSARRVSSKGRDENKNPEVAELSSLAVNFERNGIGSALVSEFCRLMQDRKVKRVILTTDEHQNDRVRSFYARQGFVLSGREYRGDRVLCVYGISLENPDSTI